MVATKRPLGGKMKLRSWRPEMPDHRDKLFRPSGEPLKAVVDPLSHDQRTHDQGQFGSCTGHAGTTLVECVLGLTGDAGQLSRMFPYYQARKMIGEEKFDNGAYNRDVIKSFVKFGCPKETTWPYKASTLTLEPGPRTYKSALPLQTEVINRGMTYESVTDLDGILAALSDGHPVMFGFMAYEAIFSLDKTNYVLPMPGPNDQPVGGHAVVADGYILDKKVIWVHNSWSRSWGHGGWFQMPFEYFTDPRGLADDFWILRPAAPAP